MDRKMVKKRGCKGILRGMMVLGIVLGLGISGKANNVRLNGTVKVTDVTSGVATLELDLTWQNSWRDNFNWDAVWLFLKYKPSGGGWSHVMLQDVVHSATNGYQVMNGKSGSNVVGVYVYPGSNGVNKNVATKVTLKWSCGSSYTKSSFDNNTVFLLAQGIEMVYIPFGAYYLGDGHSHNCLGASDGSPLAINGEEAVTLSQRSAEGVITTAVSNLNANYPKGYNGYYIMKYETSQEQYVTFLNTLSKSEQENLLGASLLANLAPGRFVFGDSLQPSYRNGIILSGKPAGQAYIFDNNLNGNGEYGEDGDGQCLACNYMSLNDMLAYASWSGLRPMSELEYERACRPPFPQEPQKGEYVWNANSGVSRVTALSALGKETEVAGGTANVNSGNGLSASYRGPVRCGIFARSSSSQTLAGATYWGVMEMSGNVRELVAGVSHSGLSYASNGSGSFSISAWTNTPTLFGVRGGSFAGADSLLRTSDRTEMINYVKSVADRDSTVGFRLTRTLDAGSVTVNPGTISLSAPLCPDVASVVSETASASISGITGDFPISYTWSYNDGSGFKVISGETGNTLSFSAFEAGKNYVFKRTTVCALGEASTQTGSLSALSTTAITVQPQNASALCGLTISVTATGTSLSYQWQKDGVNISGATSSTYSKSSTTSADEGVYRCQVIGTCGTILSDAATVTLGGFIDGTMTDQRDNQVYRTRVMPDGRTWMIENLRFGTCNASTFNSYYTGTVQNQIADGYYGVCIASTVAGGGHLYNWQAAMNHANARYNTSGNPSGNVNGNSPTQWQGICPPGWHLPSGGSTGEFQQLYASLCSQPAKFYPGTGAFEGVLGGNGDGSSVLNAGSYGYYWSSTFNSTSNAYSLSFYSGYVSPQNTLSKRNGAAVRCVQNY